MNPKQRALGSPCGRGSTRHRVTVCRAQTASDNPTSGPVFQGSPRPASCRSVLFLVSGYPIRPLAGTPSISGPHDR